MKFSSLLLLPLVFSADHSLLHRAPKLTKEFLTKDRATKINAEIIHDFMEAVRNGDHASPQKRVCRRMLRKLKQQADRNMAIYATLKNIFADFSNE